MNNINLVSLYFGLVKFDKRASLSANEGESKESTKILRPKMKGKTF